MSVQDIKIQRAQSRNKSEKEFNQFIDDAKQYADIVRSQTEVAASLTGGIIVFLIGIVMMFIPGLPWYIRIAGFFAAAFGGWLIYEGYETNSMMKTRKNRLVNGIVNELNNAGKL